MSQQLLGHSILSPPRAAQPSPALLPKPQLLFIGLLQIREQPIQGDGAGAEKNRAKKMNQKSEFSRLFSLCFFCKEGELGHPENRCIKLGIFPPSLLYGEAIGQSCEKLHKVQQNVGGFSSPPSASLNSLPFRTTAMNTNKVIPACFPVVFRVSAKHLFPKLEVLQFVRLCGFQVWGGNTLIYVPLIDFCGNAECLYLNHTVRFLWF